MTGETSMVTGGPHSLHWRVWISGASSGIGAELARQLAARGCRVAAFARREAKLAELRAAVESSGGERILTQAGDVTERGQVARAVEQAAAEFGGIDVVILNAGTGDSLFPEKFDAELVERLTKVNFLGAVYGIEAALPAMLERGSGKIVGISSIAATRGMPTAAPYCATKAALATFLESLRLDLRGRGVEVITVAPGFIRTPLTDRNRFPMPFLQPVDRAAARIIRGVQRGTRVIHFPKRLTIPVKLLGCLPVPLYDWVMRFASGKGYRKESR